MIARSPIISGSTGSILTTIFSPNERYLFVDNRSGPLSDYSTDVAMATKFRQDWQNDLYSAGWQIEMGTNMAVQIQKYSMVILWLHRMQV